MLGGPNGVELTSKEQGHVKNIRKENAIHSLVGRDTGWRPGRMLAYTGSDHADFSRDAARVCCESRQTGGGFCVRGIAFRIYSRIRRQQDSDRDGRGV